MLVFVSSPFHGNNPSDDAAIHEENLRIAREACQYVIREGHVPVAPHLLYPQFLDDRDQTARMQGIACAIRLLTVCDELWSFGEETSGMWNERACALGLDIKVFRHVGPQWTNKHVRQS